MMQIKAAVKSQTWKRRPEKHRPTLNDGDEPNCSGEAMSSNEVHENLEEQSGKHPKGQTEEDRINNQTHIPGGQWTQKVTRTVVRNRETE